MLLLSLLLLTFFPTICWFAYLLHSCYVFGLVFVSDRTWSLKPSHAPSLPPRSTPSSRIVFSLSLRYTWNTTLDSPPPTLNCLHSFPDTLLSSFFCLVVSFIFSFSVAWFVRRRVLVVIDAVVAVGRRRSAVALISRGRWMSRLIVLCCVGWYFFYDCACRVDVRAWGFPDASQ